MYGIKVASAVVGITLGIVAAIALLVIGLTTWLGVAVGGPVSFGVIMLGAFVFIAVAENRGF